MSRILVKHSLNASPLSKLVVYRGFNSISNVCFAAPTTGPKATPAFKMKSKSYEGKGAINKDFIAPRDWDLESVKTPILPELSSETAVEENLNTVFRLPAEAMNKIGTDIPLKLADKFLSTREPSLLFRKATFDILNHVKNCKNTSATPLIIDGLTGTGKSALLLQIVSQILLEDWIVLYFPEIKSLVDGSRAYLKSSSDLYLQPTAASHILTVALKFNKDKFKKIPITEPFKIGSTSFSEKSDLGQVAQLGVKDSNLSHSCLEKFFELLSKQTSIPVLLAIDEINTLYGESEYYSTESRKLQSTELSVIKSLIELVERKQILKNGLILGATSWADISLVSEAFGPKGVLKPVKEIHQGSLPSGATFDRFYTQNYNNAEAQSLAKFYHESSIIYEALTPEEVTKKLFISSGNPLKFYHAFSRLL